MDASAPDLAGMVEQMVRVLKPYADGYATFTSLPGEGLAPGPILDELARIAEGERGRWRDGFVSGGVYHGDPGFTGFLDRAYALFAASNPLHPDVWPSASKFEAEIVAMTADMLGADQAEDPVVGTVSSGGTESILLAMKTYRDWARATKGIRRPQIIAPTTAHAAFDKAADYFDMEITRIPVGSDFRASVAATAAAITPQTAVLVGSAPPFPHGIVDPIAELSELARQRGLGFHTDACLGGFLLPWAARLGYPVPPFDFRLPGVTSISADTHKYGYAPKGTSVILYRGMDLRRFQYFATVDWPGGIYFSPTLAGSRPGGLIAACWAAMVAMGEQGYLEAARRILETAAWIVAQMRQIPELQVIGDPLFLIAFRSEAFSIYQVMAYLAERGWNLNGLMHPPAVHLCLTLRHTQPGVKERFVEDLRAAVTYVKQNPQASEGIGALYGLGATVELHDMAREMLYWCLDLLYQA